MNGTSSYSEPVESTGRVSTLDQAATGCVLQASEDENGKTGDLPLAGDASTVCAATAAADEVPKRPTPPQSVRAFERALRHQLGYSQRQAAAIAKAGFRATPEVEEPDDGIEQLRDALQKSIAALKD